MRTSANFDAKNFGFFEIYGASARTRGRGSASVDIFWTRGLIFCDFVRTSFMDGPLSEKIVCRLLYFFFHN